LVIYIIYMNDARSSKYQIFCEIIGLLVRFVINPVTIRKLLKP